MKITTPFCISLRQWQEKRHPDPNTSVAEKTTTQNICLSYSAWVLKHNDKCLPLYASGFRVSETMCGMGIIEVTDPCWPQHVSVPL